MEMVLKTTSRALGIMLTLLAAINSSAQTPDSRTLAANYQRDAQKLMEQYFEPLPSGVTSACDDHVPMGRCKAHKKQCARQCNCVSNYNAAASALEARFKEQSRAINSQSTAGNRQGGTVEYSSTRQTVTSPPVVLNQGQVYAQELTQSVNDRLARQQQKQEDITTLSNGVNNVVNAFMSARNEKRDQQLADAREAREKFRAWQREAARERAEFERTGEVGSLHSWAVAEEALQNTQLAHTLYLQAAGLGYSHAFRNIAQDYFEGKGVAVNDSLGISWARKGVLAGDPSAAHDVLNYYNGKKKPSAADDDEVIHWIYMSILAHRLDLATYTKKSYHLSSDTHTLINRYKRKGGSTDIQNAIFWLDFLKNNGQSIYDEEMANKEISKLQKVLAKNKFKAPSGQESAVARFNQGVMFTLSGKTDSAIPILKEAADSGLEEAMILLGILANQRGNYNEALSWFKQVNERLPTFVLDEIDRLYAKNAISAFKRGDQSACLRYVNEGANFLLERPVALVVVEPFISEENKIYRLYSDCLGILAHLYEHGEYPWAPDVKVMQRDRVLAKKYRILDYDLFVKKSWVEGHRKAYDGY